MSKYVKLTNKECCHNGFQFHEGLNIDILPFTPYGYCEPGGIYFTTPDNIWIWLHYNDQTIFYIWDVTLPDDAQVYHQKAKSKADKIILSNRKTLYDFFSDNLDISLLNLKYDEHIFNYIDNQTPEFFLAAVQQNGTILRFITDPTPQICLAAIKQNMDALLYLDPHMLSIIEDYIREFEPSLLSEYVNYMYQFHLHKIKLTIPNTIIWSPQLISSIRTLNETRTLSYPYQ